MEPIGIQFESKSLDEAIEKANRLVELLREAKQIIDSLSKNEALSGEKGKWCIGPERKPFHEH